MSTRTEIIANLRSTWTALDGVAAQLTPEQWQAQSLCPAWTAQGVMVHATAIEQGLVGWRPGDDSPFPAIGRAHAALSELSPGDLLAQFRLTVVKRLEELDATDDATFALSSFTPIGPATYGRFMAIRVFDNWVHERDIRVPLGISGDDTGPAAEMSLDEVQGSIGFIVGKKIALPDGNAHHGPPIGPLPFPWMFLSLGAIDLFEREEAPVDGQTVLRSHISDPDRRLIRPWAHHVEVESDPFGQMHRPRLSIGSVIVKNSNNGGELGSSRMERKLFFPSTSSERSTFCHTPLVK